VLPEELPSAIERAQIENKQLRKTITDLTDQLAVHAADLLATRGTTAVGVTTVIEAVEGWDASGLKAMAMAIAARPGHVAALFTTGSPALAVVSRAADVPVDASTVLKALLARFGGKGGGRADLAQGGGLTGDTAVLLGAARELVARRP
jgi:alanyl-tRNA synthetase